MRRAIINRLRWFHAALAILVVLAYATGDDDPIHYWFGYAVALLVVFRLVTGLAGVSQLGLMKYYPHFAGLRLNNAMTHPAISRTLLLAIALSVMATVTTGIAMDRGRTLGFTALSSASAPITLTNPDALRVKSSRKHVRRYPKWLEEVHEVSGNLVLAAVACHVTYLLIWKRPLALFMLFLVKSRTAKNLPSAR